MACDGLTDSNSKDPNTRDGLWADSPSVASNIDLETDSTSPGITYRNSKR